PSGTNRTTAQGPASDPSTSSLTATRNRLASPPQSRTATHAPAPSPSHTRTPPPPSGYFGLRPVGSWSSLPSDAQCAAQVHHSTWEPRPENYQQNHSKPAPGAMAASFSSRPRARGGSYNALWDSWLLPRVDGQFTGTTDEILQWAACKWGLPDNLIRAEAAVESTWFQYLHFPQDASYGGGGGGSCYWTRGCGDAFSSPTAASVAFCNGIASEGLLPSEIHNYQKDPVTSAGGYPATPTSGLCPKTFSILGVMSWDDPRSEEHTSELQSLAYLVCRLLLEKKKNSTALTRSTSRQRALTTTTRRRPRSSSRPTCFCRSPATGVWLATSGSSISPPRSSTLLA